MAGSLTGLLCALFGLVLALPIGAPASPDAAAGDPQAAQRAGFLEAWNAARRGDRATFDREKAALEDYLLYPYLEYDALLRARRTVEPERMAAFLEGHSGWAFTEGLRRSWLRTMGEMQRWDVLLDHAEGQEDTEIRCHLGRARLARGQTEGLLREAQSLWLAGQSQPDVCDPLFDWLIREGGVSAGLAWERIKLAMEARHPRLTIYLARFLQGREREWAQRWQEQDRERYRRLDRAAHWPDSRPGRDISSYGLRRLARSDSGLAWRHFQRLDGHFAWDEAERAGILREIALWSAVDGEPGVFERMRTVAPEYRDGTLLEWWARAGLVAGDWAQVADAISQMSEALRNDDRWRFWSARAAAENGAPDQGRAELAALAVRPTYYGFLAADRLGQPYAICPEQPRVDAAALQSLKRRTDFARALELRRAGLNNWARAEWKLASLRVDANGLRLAAALALEIDWPEMVVLALADSGDLDWYEWRFPVAHGDTARRHAAAKNLDLSWVMGLMRSESAMAEDALSPAGARGLMQVTPDTARQLSRRHGIPYNDSGQLMQAEYNIQFGTAYLRDLLDKYGNNPVLASGAYNAGPRAVDRWMDSPAIGEAAIWIETLPYFETREYIPRVLAFSSIYDWRLDQPVVRVSSRMPPLNSGNMHSPQTTELACLGESSVGAK